MTDDLPPAWDQEDLWRSAGEVKAEGPVYGYVDEEGVWTAYGEDWDAPDEPAATQGPVPLVSLDLAALAGIRPKPKSFVISRLAPAGEVTLFTGPGSAGKSLLAQQFATAAAAGLSCLGFDVKQGPSIYLTCEDDAEQLHWRQDHICRALGVKMADLAGALHLISRRGELDVALVAATDGQGVLRSSAAYDRLSATIRETEARLVWLDNVAHLFAGNENDRGDVTRFVNLLNRLAGETGAAIVLIGHPNKIGDSYSGSTAWLNAVRSQFTLEHDVESDLRTVAVGKANYAQKGQGSSFLWCDWAFVLEDDLPANTAAELRDVSRANFENECFMACLRQRASQGDGRTVGPSPGPNYAPAQFDGMPQAKGLKKAALKKAMDRLFAIGKIEAVQVDRPGKSEKKTILREVV